MSDLDDNIEELKARGTLIMQLLVVLSIGVFYLFHVLISFVWGGVLAVLSGTGWVSTSLSYVQSWEFARLSVGIPVVAFLIGYIYVYCANCGQRPKDVAEEICECIAREWQGKCKFGVDEVFSGHPLYGEMRRLAERAKIEPPRLFCCRLSIVCPNAFAMVGQNGEGAIVLYDTMLCSPLVQLRDAVIAHELGHLVNKDSRRSLFVNCAIVVFKLMFLKGCEFYQVKTRECLIDRKADEFWLISIVNAAMYFVLGLLLMLIGWIPWSFAQGLLWWRDYTAEYLADAVGAKLLGDGRMMADMLVVLRSVFIKSEKAISVSNVGLSFKVDEHPATIGRIRRLVPDFNGDWEMALRDVVRRRGIK